MKLIQTNISRDLRRTDVSDFQQRVIELEDDVTFVKLYQIIKKNLGYSISDTGLVKNSYPLAKGILFPEVDHPVLSKIDCCKSRFGVKGFRNDYEYTTLISVLER